MPTSLDARPADYPEFSTRQPIDSHKTSVFVPLTPFR